jgi:hypothetical protein
LNNEIGDEGQGRNVQQEPVNTPEYSVGIGSVGIPLPSEASDAVGKAKTSLVWRLFNKDDTNGRAICKFCKSVYVHKKGEGTGTLDRHMKISHINWYENLLKQQQIHATGGRVVGNFQFEHKRNREGFARMVVENRLSFGFGDS